MKIIRLLAVAFGAAFFYAGAAQAQNVGTVTNHAFAVGKGPGVQGLTSVPCATAGMLPVGQTGADPICRTVTGDVTITSAGVTAIGTAKVTYAMMQNVAALSVIGRSANSSGVPAAISCVAGSDAVLRESGSVLGCGTIATAGLANNAVTNAKAAQMAAYTLKGNSTGSTANQTDIDVTALTSKPSPVSGDIVLIQDSAASNAFKRTTVGALSSAGSVASIAGNTGAFTLSNGITNSANDIRLASIADKTMLANTTGSSAIPAATNLAAGGASMVLLSCQTASASASLNFDNLITSAYPLYTLRIASLTPTTDDVSLRLRVGTGAGPTYQTTGYTWGASRVSANPTVFTGNGSTLDAVADAIYLSAPGAANGVDNGGTLSGGFSGTVSFAFTASTVSNMRMDGTYTRSDGAMFSYQGGGAWQTATTLTSLQLLFSSGTAATGKACLFAHRDS